MTDTAAHLIDRVLPRVPVRQWVLTLPFDLRRRLAYDADLNTAVLNIFIRAISGHYRQKARRQGLADPHSGAVTAIHRASSSLALNLHYHSLFLDGVFTRDDRDAIPRFHPLPALSDEDVQRVVATVHKRVVRMLGRRALIATEEGDPPQHDDLSESQLHLAALYDPSLAGGPIREGGLSPRRKGRLRQGPVRPLCAQSDGFDLHAAVRIPAHKRGDLECLCRYILRPPLAIDRLNLREDGSIALGLKRPWRDGTRTLLYRPLALVHRLVAMIPAPRRHTVRYHGVLAPASTWRPKIIALVEPRDQTGRHPRQLGAEQQPRQRRLDWASLLKRVFAIDILVCARCGGRRVVLALIESRPVARAILEHLGLPAEPPPLAPARGPPLLEFAA